MSSTRRGRGEHDLPPLGGMHMGLSRAVTFGSARCPVRERGCPVRERARALCPEHKCTAPEVTHVTCESGTRIIVRNTPMRDSDTHYIHDELPDRDIATHSIYTHDRNCAHTDHQTRRSTDAQQSSDGPRAGQRVASLSPNGYGKEKGNFKGDGDGE